MAANCCHLSIGGCLSGFIFRIYAVKPDIKRAILTVIMTNNALCQQYLSLLYQGTKGHQSLKCSEQNTIPLSYGEILYPGVDRLLAEVTLSEKDVFFDLGSGLGKVVLQVFLKTAVRKV